MIYLHDINGYNYKEVAEILGISLGTVKSRAPQPGACESGE